MSSTDFAQMFEGQYGLEQGEFNRRFTAEAVAEGVVLLAHPSLDCTGEVFTLGGTRMARVFFGVTRGVRADSAEGYAAQWDAIVDPAQFTIPGYALDAEEANISEDRIDWLSLRD
ncbi:MAG: hypothetical protein ACK5H2_11490 [Beutenbergiaceae bacterium]